LCMLVGSSLVVQHVGVRALGSGVRSQTETEKQYSDLTHTVTTMHV